MASYKVVFKPSVEKDLRHLSKALVQRIMERIETLADTPLPRQSVKLAGAERMYRIRVGDYRIVYTIERKPSR